MFGLIKMKSGATALLVHLSNVKCECCHPNPGVHQTTKKMGLGPLPNELWCSSNEI